MWITSSRVLPIIMLVVIPFSSIILAIALSAFVPLTLIEPVELFSYIFSYLYLISASSLVYAFYFVKFDNIKRRGFSNLMVEQDYVKKILFIEVPILIFATVYSASFLLPEFLYDFLFGLSQDYLSLFGRVLGIDASIYFPESTGTVSTYPITYFFHWIFFNGLMTNLGFSVTAGIIWMIIVTTRKELGYFLAKELIQIAAREMKVSKKAEYLIEATKAYDKYLRRTLNLEINCAKNPYSKILSDSNLDLNDSIQKISDSFKSENELEPIKSLSKIAYVKDDKEPFLVDESIGKRIKDMAIFFATIIPVIVGVIQLWLQTTAKPQPSG